MSEFILCETGIPRGLSVIEASAGTGKTWTLGHLLPRLIIDGRISTIDQVLMVSFTEDSTRELAERVRHYLNGLAQLLLDQDPRPSANPDLPGLIARAARAAGEGQKGLALLLGLLGSKPAEELPQLLRNLLRAQLDCDRLMVSTIHALCRRVLSDEGFLCGTPSGFEVRPDISDLKLEALRDTWRARLASNKMLAHLAVAHGWSMDRDLKAWSLLEPLDSALLHGHPRSVLAQLKDLGEALADMKTHQGDLETLKGILAGDVTLNAKARELHADDRGKALVAKDADLELPGLAALGQAQWLAYAEDCVRKQYPKNLAARDLIKALPLIKAAKRAAKAADDLEWAWRNEALAEARKKVTVRLRKANALSFNDLIGMLDQALHGPAGDQIAERLRKRWKVALVDESQDTDPRQLAIFEKIFNAPAELDQSLVLIGDPKQSIYGFRGADLEAYEDARDRQPKVHLSDLVRTHRSAKGLVEALNLLFKQPDPLGSPRLRLLPAVPVKSDAELPLPDGEEARLVAALVGEEDQEAWGRASQRIRLSAEAAAHAVAELLEKKEGAKRVEPGQCAVLTRSNAQARAVREALAALGVAAVVRDDGDVLAGEEAADLALILRAVLKPASQGYRRAALATRMLGFTAKDLASLDEAHEQDWQLLFSAWGDAWRKRGIAALMAALDEGGRLSLSLAKDTLGERRLTDLRHLAEILQAEEAERRLAPDRMLEWMQSAIGESKEAVPPAERLQRLEQDGSAVQILTVHRAKGLEFDYVFCPYLWHARVPKTGEMRVAKLHGDRGLADPKFLDAGDQATLAHAAIWQSLEEELRLAYVALTRGKRRVWFIAGYVGYSKGISVVPPSALDWILRDVREETREDWYQRVAVQKRQPNKSEKDRIPPYTCEHEARLRVLARDPRISVQAVSLEGPAYQAATASLVDLKHSESGPLKLRVWRMSSYSSLLRGQGPERDVHDSTRHPEQASQAGPDVPLADFVKGAEAGECLHQVLEVWDFQAVQEDLLRKILERNGMAEAVQTVAAFLPELAGAVIPGLGSLGEVAKQASLSEWHFVLPLGLQGVDGEALSAVFAKHPDARVRAYAASLKNLAPERVNGMLQGYIDRLVRKGPLWAVVDWKSNHLGKKAGDYAQEALWACAAESHYILQVHLYQAALRRYLRQRGNGNSIHGAALAFLRGMRAGTSDGILYFPAEEAFMDQLEGLFLGAKP